MAKTQQPVWTFIDNLGDANPIDYGGYFIFKDETGVYPEEAELLVPLEENDTYEIYRIVLDPLKMLKGYLVPAKYKKSWPHPLPQYDEWFHKDLEAVAGFVGSNKEDLEAAFTSSDPLVRAEAYRAIGDYHGWDNLDSDPLTNLSRAEVEKRYPEFA